MNLQINRMIQSYVLRRSVPAQNFFFGTLCFRSIHLQKAGTMLSAATAARSVAKKVRWMISTL